MWSTRLLVLGLVRWIGPVHGYLVRRELDTWRMPGVPEIGAGSIYHALKKLTADGLIEIVATESVDDRPARTTYRATVEGEREFQRLVREKLWEVPTADDPFHTAWSFGNALSDTENSAMLRQRADTLYDRIDALTGVLAATAPGALDSEDEPMPMPPHSRALLKRQADLWLVDAEWCEQTAERIESGELEVGPEPSRRDAERWRGALGSPQITESAEVWQRIIESPGG